MKYEDILRTPRLSGLRFSPDGSRYLLNISEASDDGATSTGRLREFDAAGALLREVALDGRRAGAAAYLPSGELVVAATVLASASDSASGGSELWVFPVPDAAAAVPRRVLEWPVPIRGLKCAGRASVVVFETELHPHAATPADDRAIEAGRTTRAVLHESELIRFWDRELGPRTARFFRLQIDGQTGSQPEELTPGADGLLLEATGWDVSPDGGALAIVRRDPLRPTRLSRIVVYRPGAAPHVLGRSASWYETPRFSADGRMLLCLRRDVGEDGAVAHPRVTSLEVEHDIEGDVLDGVDTWPSEFGWAPGAGQVFVVGPADGYDSLSILDLDEKRVVRSWRRTSVTDVQFAGGAWRALASGFSSPPSVVTLGEEESAPPTEGAGAAWRRSFFVTEDGSRLPYWLLLPDGLAAGEKVPVVMFANAYNPASWTDRWFYRWNPTAWASEGYAVVLADIRPSLGAGLRSVESGWGRWNQVSLEDLHACLDDLEGAEHVDIGRVALLGGAWGGWVAGWAAVHSDRFRAIAWQGGAWNIDSYQSVTDQHDRWEDQLGDPVSHRPRYLDHSPALSLDGPTVPVLVFAGADDYRAPVGDSIAAAHDLRRAGTDVRLLLFADEGHRIGRITSERLWYDLLAAFFATHLRDRPWAPPAGL